MSRHKKSTEQKPIKVLTLDTETRGLFGEIFRVGFYDGDDNKYYAANSIKEIKNTLINYSTKYECHVFIHNLDFDLSKMAHELIPESNLKDSIFINNNVTVFSSSVVATQSQEENEIISQPITFHDSNKLILGKLSKICKDFGLDEYQSKIDLKDHILSIGWGRDYDGNPTDDPDKYDAFASEGYYFEHVDPWEKQLNEYLRMDCVSLYHVVKTLIDIAKLPIEEFLKCPTTASLALKVFSTNYTKDYNKIISTMYRGRVGEANEQFVRDAYCGGRTEVFIPEITSGFHNDVNSLYPYVMETFQIPFGKPTMYHNQNAHKMFTYWYNTRMGAGFCKVDIDIPDDLFIPPLPVKRFNKLMFPTGKITGTWSFEEIDLALEMGCKIHKIHQCLYFDKKDYLFKDFISYFKDMKIKSKGAKKVFAKLMQNSLYGKFGMRRVRKTLLPISELSKCIKRENEQGLRYIVLKNPLVGNEQFIEAEIKSSAMYIQPHVAAYVTSLARIVLYRGLIQQYSKGIVAYCDTDSIVSEYEMDNDQVDDDEYGKWALESIVENGIFIQPKTYIEKGLIKNKQGEWVANVTKKFKGIPARKMTDITYDTYKDILNELKEIQLKQQRGEKVSKKDAYYPLYKSAEKKRIKFATTLKNGHTDFDMHVEIKKGMLLTNMQKRNMDYINNTSKPHKLKEW